MKNFGKFSFGLWVATLSVAVIVSRFYPDLIASHHTVQSTASPAQAARQEVLAKDTEVTPQRHKPVSIQDAAPFNQSEVKYPLHSVSYPYWRVGFADITTMDVSSSIMCAPSSSPLNLDASSGLRICSASDNGSSYAFIFTGQKLKFDANKKAMVHFRFLYEGNSFEDETLEALPKYGDDTVLSISTNEQAGVVAARMLTTKGVKVSYELANGHTAKLYFVWPKVNSTEVFKWNGSL